jgi:hypothetical protein
MRSRQRLRQLGEGMTPLALGYSAVALVVIVARLLA